MNFKLVFKLVGKVLFAEAIALLIPMLVALIYQEDVRPFMLSACIVALVSFFLSIIPSTKNHFFAREGFFATGLIWLLMGIFGALPFQFSGYFPSFIDCLFESFSGFTTTGATILTDIEVLPKGLLFWRSFTHWIGGIGVLALSLILLPALGARSQYLTKAETPGPVFSKLVPKQSHSSSILYAIYCTLTLLQIIALRLAGLPLYDSILHTFSTAGTGGFSSRNLSVGAYGSPLVEMIIAVFILLFSINFAIYYLLICRRFRDIWKSDELRFFLGVVAVSTVAVSLNIRPLCSSLSDAFRLAFFQVSSIISTTGFSTDNFNNWPEFSQMLLIMLMFCGACSGSTGGGMKCSRVLLVFRCIKREIHRIIHPRAVSVVKLDGRVLEEDTVNSVLIFSGAFVLFTLAASLLISLDNFSFTTSFTAAITCVSNSGPGLDLVGPYGNFLIFSPRSKLIMCLCMVVGRLEVFPILVLFSRNAWKRA